MQMNLQGILLICCMNIFNPIKCQQDVTLPYPYYGSEVHRQSGGLQTYNPVIAKAAFYDDSAFHLGRRPGFKPSPHYNRMRDGPNMPEYESKGIPGAYTHPKGHPMLYEHNPYLEFQKEEETVEKELKKGTEELEEVEENRRKNLKGTKAEPQNAVEAATAKVLSAPGNKMEIISEQENNPDSEKTAFGVESRFNRTSGTTTPASPSITVSTAATATSRKPRTKRRRTTTKRPTTTIDPYEVRCPARSHWEPIVIPDPEDCTAYYSCFHGLPLYIKCPFGNNFSTFYGRCVVESLEPCDQRKRK